MLKLTEDKLLKLKGLMNTETGRRIAERRHAFLERFLDEYLAETGGQRQDEKEM